MNPAFLIPLFIILAFYILGAYATTDILRLLDGCEIAPSSKDCFCPVCGQKIPLYNQIPIFSFFINKGVCRSCHSPMPKKDLFLEVFIFLSMTASSVLLDFSWSSFILDIMIFEVTKIVFLYLYGIRKKNAVKELVMSLSRNVLIFIILAALYFINDIVVS